MNSPLQATSVTITAGEKTLVDDVSFAVSPGRTLAIVGESGAGKSMLSQAVTGLLPTGVSATGTVNLLDSEIDLSAGPAAFSSLRGSGIVWLPQDPFTSLSPTHRIGKQILAHPPRGRRAQAERISQRLRDVSLDPKLARAYPHQLSGGMRQRVAIAAAIDPEPSVLIADEPTTALDVTTQKEVLTLLQRLSKERQMSLVLITHDLGVAREYGDDIIVMRHGRIIEGGRTSEVLDSPRRSYTKALAIAEPRLDGDSPRPAARPAGAALLEVTNASKSFGSTRALDQVSLRVHSGEAVSIVGESGSGKTTLARSIVGLEKLDSGTIHFENPGGGSKKTRLQAQRRLVQIVFQNPYSALNPAHKIDTILREALKLSGQDSSVADLLAQVELPTDYAKRIPAQLSGGERQRVAIARALAPKPQLLICDEAVSALDVSVQAQILALLQSLQQELDLTLLFITHDLAVARHISDRLLVMKSGVVVEEGATEEVLHHPVHPYTANLLSAVPGGGSPKEVAA